MTRQDTLCMLGALQVCPQFGPSLFGEPDYWAPAVIRSREKSGKVYRAGKRCHVPKETVCLTNPLRILLPASTVQRTQKKRRALLGLYII
jgi:hypothetical protein